LFFLLLTLNFNAVFRLMSF